MSVEIFLDTNVFESANFIYNSQTMNLFLEHCHDNQIKLMITDVVEHEVEKRIDVNITESLEGSSKKNLAVLAASVNIDSSLSKLKIIEKLENNLKNTFRDFIDDNDIEILNTDFEPQELVSQYFEKRNPFTEQKKYEFPDAMILLTIKKYIAEYPNKTIFTISNDKSFMEFSQVNNIENFKFIGSSLNYLIQNPNVALTNALSRQIENIKEQTIDYIENIDDFILYSYDSIDLVDVDNIDIGNVDINELNIIKFEEHDKMIFIEVALSINFTCNAYYPDPDTLHYDKEDGIYYSFSKCSSEINFTEKVTSSLEIAFDDNFDFDILEVEIHNKEFEFYLDERYIVSTEYEDSNISTF